MALNGNTIAAKGRKVEISSHSRRPRAHRNQRGDGERGAVTGDRVGPKRARTWRGVPAARQAAQRVDRVNPTASASREQAARGGLAKSASIGREELPDAAVVHAGKALAEVATVQVNETVEDVGNVIGAVASIAKQRYQLLDEHIQNASAASSRVHRCQEGQCGPLPVLPAKVDALGPDEAWTLHRKRVRPFVWRHTFNHDDVGPGLEVSAERRCPGVGRAAFIVVIEREERAEVGDWEFLGDDSQDFDNN